MAIGMSNASGSVRLHLYDGGIKLNVGSQRLSLSFDGLTHNGKKSAQRISMGVLRVVGAQLKSPNRIH